MKIYNINDGKLTKNENEAFSVHNLKLFRLIRNAFWSVSSYFFTTIASFKKISLSEEEKEFHTLERQQTNPYLYVLVNQLITNQTLSDISLNLYYNNYLKNKYDNLQVDFSYLSPSNTKNEGEKNYIYIPFSIEKSHYKIIKLLARIFRLPMRDHYSHILIDKKNKIVEYYDPKGLLDSDRANSHVKHTKQKISDCVSAIITKYSLNDYTLYKHTYQNQIDSYNCGVYGLHYLEKRLKNGNEKLLENQRAAKLPFCKVRDFRKTMVKNIWPEYTKSADADKQFSNADINTYLEPFSF
ncbi:MAG: hypothetical protein AMS24_03070 [Chlamydiae bacterium SM23_39]|nr:MAG: hypothetical protein AMS24_03070 [Chlamydiae bacterium SM23_39]